jgi:hypothetical protein
MAIYVKSASIDGSSGGSVEVDPESKATAIAISGRSSGVISVAATINGSDLAEAFTPELEINLGSGERSATIDGYPISSFTFTPSESGSDFTVTVTQWPV